MAGEQTYPCLPCRDLDESIAFYEAMGFKRTYRQLRPNPYAVVARDDWQIHLFGMEQFNPADSYGSVIVVVPDAEALYQALTEGLKAAYGKLPTVGIPRVLRPRKKYGTVSGFSVVDPGGNWLRVYKAGDSEEDAEASTGLARIIEVAARLGDARGEEAIALTTLENGLARYPQAPAADRTRAHLYRVELLWRLNKQDAARSALEEAKAILLDTSDLQALQKEIDDIEELLRP
jgi:catechol 2,3-dioxygenase-like lactoylglutathione lyase family enzyme